jgi:hypothetical protein
MTLLMMGASILARETVAKGWAKTASDDAPPQRSNKDISVKEAAAWALVSGSIVGIARVVARRAMGYRGTPQISRSS